MIDFDGEKKVKAPMMMRTKAQLQTAYAPGAMFTFESNLVMCRSIPDQEYIEMQLNPYTTDLIFMGINETMENWLDVAMKANSDINIEPHMCIDKRALHNERLEPAEVIFSFAEPARMGYTPDLLTFVCTNCKMMINFDSPLDMQVNISSFREPCLKNLGATCNWQQMDIVFIHPNGNLTAPLPYIRRYDEDSKKVIGKYTRCICTETRVKLIRHGAQIGKYQLVCASCGAKRTGNHDFWLQNDEEYLRELGPRANQNPFFVRMKPISARSNSVFYIKQDMVIDFNDKEQTLSAINTPGDKGLKTWLARKYGMPVREVPIEEKKRSVIGKLGEDAWKEYEEQRQSYDTLKESMEDMPEKLRSSVEKMLGNSEKAINLIEKEWEDKGVYEAEVDFPARLARLISERKDIFAPKYDPFRLHLEHKVLLDEVVTSRKMDNGLAHYTRVDQLDEFVGPDDEDKRRALNLEHRSIMDSIGIEHMGLVRDFKTINYSYGFTRVDSKPITSYINQQEVPVRLNLFPKTRFSGVDRKKHPIFTLKQNNEAIYVKLQEETVRKWLEVINTEESLTDEPLGLQYLENAVEMSQYLTEIENPTFSRPSLSLSIYTLVHTYSHHVMNAISEYSGLGTGSLSEYIFPADLAFIVYRKGMTMDMGNLSSILRNNAPAFLDYLHQPRNLSCGSGSLCKSRGGACPDCILVHEMSCIAQNKLLSRSVLVGKGHPMKYGFHADIEGYINIAKQSSK